MVRNHLVILAAAFGLAANSGCQHSPSQVAPAEPPAVQTCPLLAELGVTIKDWTYSDETLSVQLEARKDFGEPWVIGVEADDGRTVFWQFPLKADESKWVELGGPKSRFKLPVTPQARTITILCKQRHYRAPEPKDWPPLPPRS